MSRQQSLSEDTNIRNPIHYDPDTESGSASPFIGNIDSDNCAESSNFLSHRINKSTMQKSLGRSVSSEAHYPLTGGRSNSSSLSTATATSLASSSGGRRPYSNGSSASVGGSSSGGSSSSSCKQRMESHQYEPDQSEVWWHHQLQRHFEDKGRWWTFARKSEFLRWTLTLLAGGICGVAAFLVTFFTGSLTSFKFRTFYLLLEQEKSGDIPYGTAFGFLFITCLIFAFVGWMMVYIEPLAAGSGIPEVKVYLNGLDMPRLMWIRTLLCKGVGIIFAVASGLPLGKEGPMVLVGSIIAAELSQVRTSSNRMSPCGCYRCNIMCFSSL